MNRYYSRTFVGMAAVLAVLAGAAVFTNSAAGEAKVRHTRLADEAQRGTAMREANHAELLKLERAIDPARTFEAAWRPFAALPEKDAAERIRAEIEAMAQRQLGLVTDNAITPQPDRHPFQGTMLRVQRVTLRASGRDLAALLTWLGKVEERYPAAIVEVCEFSSNVGGSTALTIRLVQPVTDIGAERVLTWSTARTVALSPEEILALGWAGYSPEKLKRAVPVGVHRNPLQPAIAGDHAVFRLRDGSDDVTPQLEQVLEGRIRSVIRGPAPLVVIDGRIFRVGDELTLGTTRDRPVPGAKTKLKKINEEALVFQVSGGTSGKPILCDVAIALPAFLKSR